MLYTPRTKKNYTRICLLDTVILYYCESTHKLTDTMHMHEYVFFSRRAFKVIHQGAIQQEFLIKCVMMEWNRILEEKQQIQLTYENIIFLYQGPLNKYQ